MYARHRSGRYDRLLRFLWRAPRSPESVSQRHLVVAILGSILAPRIVARFGLGPTFLVTSIVQGVTTFFMPLAGVMPALAVPFFMVPSSAAT